MKKTKWLIAGLLVPLGAAAAHCESRPRRSRAGSNSAGAAMFSYGGRPGARYNLMERRSSAGWPGARSRKREGVMAYNQELDARVEETVTPWGAVRKKMFGGTGYLLEGNMLAGVLEDSLILRLSGEEGAAALKQPHVRLFTISKNPMSGWVMVDVEALDDDALLDWLEQARDFVVTLPAKSSQGR
jgi:TfoX/Sxy family transcriptional regulator of competence genes